MKRIPLLLLIVLSFCAVATAQIARLETSGPTLPLTCQSNTTVVSIFILKSGVVADDGSYWCNNGVWKKGTVIAASEVPAGIDAAKIGDGSVSTAEFQFLNTVTSNVQTQVDGKQASLGFTPENVANKDTDVNLAANSDTKYASQKAVKAYVDSHAGGGTPGGSNTQVQFNDSSAFGGDAGLTYNKASDVLTAVGGFVGPLTGNVTGNVSGTAGNLSGTPALPNGTTATTQSQADASTKLATTAYVDTGLGGKQSTLTNSAGLRGALSDENGTGAALFDGDTSATHNTPVIAGGMTASGSGANTFAGSTGTFLTSTGAVTIGPGAVGISGIATFTPPVRSSGVASYFTLTPPTDTGQTASTESIGANFATGTRTWADGTVALQRERFFAGPTYNKTTTSATFTDVFNSYFTPPVAGSGVTFTRGHTLGIVDSTSAISAITGGLVVAATLGTAPTSVGIGGGNIFAGGSISVGTSPAQTGPLNLPNNSVIYFRNATNNGDQQALSVNASNNVSVGGLWTVNTATGAWFNNGPYPIYWTTNAVAMNGTASGMVEVNNATTGTFRDLKVRQYYADATNTTAGTTGNQTINKAAGTVNIAAAGTTVTVTDNLCTVNSLVFAVIRTNDATAVIKNVVPGAGSFVITLNAAPTAEISVGFFIVNQ